MSDIFRRTINFIKTTKDFIFYLPTGKTVFLSQPVYRDEYPAFLIEAGAQAAPDAVNLEIGGVHRRIRGFDGAETEERLSGSFEIPHDYQTGGQIEIHIHWRASDTDAGNVEWHFDWEYSGVNKAPEAMTTISKVIAASGVQYQHQITVLGFLPANGYTIGDKIGFNIRRTPLGDNDTYGSEALFEQIALHVPVDTLGSRQRYVK